MNLDLRPVGAGFIPLRGSYRGYNFVPPQTFVIPVSRRRQSLRGLGDGTCQIPKPGQPMYYPPCPGYETAATPVTTSPGTYVAPTLTPAENCQPPYPGATPDPACIERNLVTEAANQARLDAANRSVFVQDCENAWQENANQYRALGLPVPPDDCAYRTYGQVLPGTTGGTTAYLPNTPQSVIDWRSANPSGGVMNAWDPGSAETLKEFNAPPAQSVTPTATPTVTSQTPAGSAPKGTAPAGGTAPKTGAPGGGTQQTTATGGDEDAWYRKPAVVVGGVAVVGFLIWMANR